MKVGDLVWYEAEYRNSERDSTYGSTYNIPGIVVDLDLDDDDGRILVVQWFDWEAGTFANEDPDVLEVLSEAR